MVSRRLVSYYYRSSAVRGAAARTDKAMQNLRERESARENSPCASSSRVLSTSTPFLSLSSGGDRHGAPPIAPAIHREQENRRPRGAGGDRGSHCSLLAARAHFHAASPLWPKVLADEQARAGAAFLCASGNRTKDGLGALCGQNPSPCRICLLTIRRSTRAL